MAEGGVDGMALAPKGQSAIYHRTEMGERWDCICQEYRTITIKQRNKKIQTMTANKLIKIEKIIALALAAVNVLLIVLGIVSEVNIIGPVIGLVVMVVLYAILVVQEKKLNGK